MVHYTVFEPTNAQILNSTFVTGIGAAAANKDEFTTLVAPALDGQQTEESRDAAVAEAAAFALEQAWVVPICTLGVSWLHKSTIDGLNASMPWAKASNFDLRYVTVRDV
jgi:hypothetical protein